jgi:hypothetical protein
MHTCIGVPPSQEDYCMINKLITEDAYLAPARGECYLLAAVTEISMLESPAFEAAGSGNAMTNALTRMRKL